MALSYYEVVSDGFQTDFLINFPYISQDHVKYYLDGELQDGIDREFITDTLIRITAPAAGKTIKFQRESSPETPIVDWAGGAGVSSINLDTNTLQMLYVAQETIDQADIVNSAAYAAAAEASAISAAANAQIAEDSAIALEGAVSIAPAEYTGDGSTVDFILAVTPADKYSLIVQVGGVIQDADAYDVDSNILTFTDAPADGVDIYIRNFGVTRYTEDVIAIIVDVPDTAVSTGTAGSIAFDTSYFYICVATNTWKRVSISTW